MFHADNYGRFRWHFDNAGAVDQHGHVPVSGDRPEDLDFEGDFSEDDWAGLVAAAADAKIAADSDLDEWRSR